MKLPSRERAEHYFEEFHVFENVKNHCTMVNKVAVLLAKKLQQGGEKIDLELVDRLSLLHDLFKAIVIKNLGPDPKFKCSPTTEQMEFWKKMQTRFVGKHETEIFSEIFYKEFSDFAALMLHYGDHDILTSQKSREEQIVHYADWRVFLDTIVSLKERTDDLVVRYKKKIGTLPEKKKQWEKRVADEFAVEESIFEKLDITPEELAEAVIEKQERSDTQ